MLLDDETRRIREETKKRFKTMTFSQKAEYFFMYYKWVLAVAAGVILLLFAVKDWMENMKKQQILGIMAISCDQTLPDDVTGEIKEIIGGSGKYEEVGLIRTIMSDPETGEFDYNSQMAFVAMLQGYEVDVILMPEKTTDTAGGTALFSSLSEKLEGETLGDNVHLDGDFLVLEPGHPAYEDFGFYYEPVYVGLVGYSKNEEYALAWIRSLARLS